jgi:hypothetical protein
MYSKILNPETNRLVNVNGKIGRKIINNYMSIVSGGEFSPLVKKQLKESQKIRNRTLYIPDIDLYFGGDGGMMEGWIESEAEDTHKLISELRVTGDNLSDDSEDYYGRYTNTFALQLLNDAMKEIKPSIEQNRRYAILKSAKVNLTKFPCPGEDYCYKLTIDLNKQPDYYTNLTAEELMKIPTTSDFELV